MEIKGKISVVIVNFNAGPDIVNAVNSVLLECFEVIIVDNNSSDGSIELLESQIDFTDKMHIIRNATNLGFAKACNIGYKVASGEFIFFINPDCELEPKAAINLLDVIQSQSNIGMVGGLLLNSDGSEQEGGRRFIPTPWLVLISTLRLTFLSRLWPKLFFNFNLNKIPLPNAAIEVEAISGACMLVSRKAVQVVGLFDENYFMHCEDLDWCFRFKLNNWKIMFVPAARVWHKKGVCSRSRQIFVEWHKHKGIMYFYQKFFQKLYPSIFMRFIFIAIWLQFFLKVIYYTIVNSLLRIRLLFG